MSYFTENLLIYFQIKEKWNENGLELLSVKNTFEFFLNVFAVSSDKNICPYSKVLEPAISCFRDQDIITAPARHM